MSSTSSTPKTIYLKDYTPPNYLIPQMELYFSLHEDKTTVTAKMRLVANPAAVVATPMTAAGIQRSTNAISSTPITPPPLVLDGENLKLISLKINDRVLTAEQYTVTADSLTLHHPPAQDFQLEVITEIEPQNNKSFIGLYKTKKIFCTQMEAQGFRRVTYFLDRPDVLTKYTTTIEADKKLYPQLLSNGDSRERKNLDNGRHSVTWQDPFPKPCYLFALVAGDLSLTKDTYTTRSGRKVELEIYTDKGNESRCKYAMTSLQQAMAWDETTYGLEYDLNVYMIVAVDDFNMGAMENKGLNIFNSKYVLADKASATDAEFMGIQSVVAHEYFHNWSGNRVTCRDWFQLSLKEGFTVFRDQEFSSDLNSRGVKRIEDVVNLRTRQFPEDASGMAHPIRPSSYIAIDNFYTRTVYDKGAEVIRMLHTLLGHKLFILGAQNYFKTFDGQAVTTDDFIKIHEITSGKDLSLFKNWYNQAGTPTVRVREHYESATQQLTLTLEQETLHPVTHEKNKPYQMPIRYAAFTEMGQPLTLLLIEGEESTPGVLNFYREQQTFIFKSSSRPVLSLLREFSAPVKMVFEQSDNDLFLLMAKDTDPFNRFEACQKLYIQAWLQAIHQCRNQQTLTLDPRLLTAMKDAFPTSLSEDLLLSSKLLSLPSLSYFMQFCADENPQTIETAYVFLVDTIQKNLWTELQKCWEWIQQQTNLSTAKAAELRALKGVVLFYLSWKKPDELLTQEYNRAQTMTDVMNVLPCATHSESLTSLFADFKNRWKDDSLVMNKWFLVQALSLRKDALALVQQLTNDPCYDKTNPNKIFSLIAAFATANPLRFHQSDGSGYLFIAEQIMDIDSRNPQVAARVATCFNDWSRWSPPLRKLARQQIERIHQHPQISKNVYEIMDRALKMK